MASAFEAPDSRQHPFERNTVTLSVDDALDISAVAEVLAQLAQNATEILQEKRRLVALSEEDKLQRVSRTFTAHSAS